MSKEKINIKICCGTNCYITGGADLHAIKEHLPKHLITLTNIIGVNCGSVCENLTEKQKSPIAWVNDIKIERATIEKIKQKLLVIIEDYKQ